MSSSPGLPLQQVTTTASPNTLPSRAPPTSHQQQQISRSEKRDSTRTASPNRSPRNTVEGDSEAETVVVLSEGLPTAAIIPAETRKKPNTSAIAENGETNEHEGGRRRRASEAGGTGGGRGGGERAVGIRREGTGGAAEGGRERSGRDGGNGSRGRGVAQMANERKPRGRPPKRRAKVEDEDEDEHDSSDLSSVPSRSSRTGSPSYPIHRRKVKQQRPQPSPSQPEHQEKQREQREQRERQTQHNGGLRKRKVSGFASGVRADSSGSEAENSDDLRHSRARRRKRRRSLPPHSPPPQSRLPIKSSPPPSPHSLSPFKSSARIKVRSHAGQQALKYRKIPPPLNSLSREKRSGDEASSSSPSSRDDSPAHTSRHLRRHQSSVRTPGSPVSMSHKPKRDTAGRTHLHRACQRGAVAEVETILGQGKEFLNEEDNAGYMPLHEACLHGHLDVVKVLINNGAWLDVPSRLELDTPLLDAVDNGHADVVKYLLELGADPRKRNKQGQTALDANDANRETPEVFQEIEDLLKVAINKLRTKRSSDDENPRASAAADSHSSRDPSVASPVHQSPQASSVPTAPRRRNARTERSRKDLLWLDAGKDGLRKFRETAREGDQQMVHA